MSDKPTQACGSLWGSANIAPVLGTFWRVACEWSTGAPALYKVSIPSGIIMIRHVPTSKPVPIDEMAREWFCDSPKESGRRPARKDLRSKGKSATAADVIRRIL